MLVAAAVCPCPPLLVPEVAAGAAPELDTARAACLDAVGVLAASRPDLLVVVGPGAGRSYPSGGHGSFRGFGVALDVTLGEPRPAAQEPPCRTPSPWVRGCWTGPAGRAHRSRGSRWTRATPPASAHGPERGWPPAPTASRSW